MKQLVFGRECRACNRVMGFDQNLIRRGCKGQMVKGFKEQAKQFKFSSQVLGSQCRDLVRGRTVRSVL